MLRPDMAGASADVAQQEQPSSNSAKAALMRRAMPYLGRSKRRVRLFLNRIDDEPVRRARGLMKALRTDPPDILWLGDSMLAVGAVDDTDRRRVQHMAAEEVGPGVTWRIIDGAGFNPDMYNGYLRLVQGSSARPLLILPLCIRVRTPLILHPVYGKRRSIERLRQIDPAKGRWRVHAAFPPATPEEFEAFYKLPYDTILGPGVVGDFVQPIKELERSGRDNDELLRLRFAYHHGSLLSQDGYGIDEITEMGRMVRELGCEAVIYESPVPVPRTVELLGPELHDRILANFELIRAAYREGAGADARIIENGMVFPTDEFADPDDGTEHLNQVGRARLAHLIATEVKQRLNRDA
jgi:hypothetical protein